MSKGTTPRHEQYGSSSAFLQTLRVCAVRILLLVIFCWWCGILVPPSPWCIFYVIPIICLFGHVVSFILSFPGFGRGHWRLNEQVPLQLRSDRNKMGPLEALSLLCFQVMFRKQWPSFGPELSWALSVRLLPASQQCSCQAQLALSSVPGNTSGEQTSVQLYRCPQSASVGSMMTTLNLEVR